MPKNKINSFEELYNLWENKIPLIWKDPDFIESNDYTINWIEDLVYLLDEDNLTPVLIRYNKGKSEANVFLHEILYK